MVVCIIAKLGVPRSVIIWILSRKIFVITMIVFLIISLLTLLITDRTALLLLAFPIVIGQLYGRYFDDTKDARESERSLSFALKEFQAYLCASESNFFDCYKEIY